MNTSQAIALAKDWVETHGRHVPGFCGAHLMGGLTYAPKDAPFADYRDIDLNIVLQDAPGGEVHDLLYQGRILEYGVVGLDRYRSAEAILSDIELASNLAVDSILADPLGLLAGLQPTVARDYARRQWVVARCDQMKNAAQQSLADLSQARSPVEALFPLGFFGLNVAGLLACASLRPPTHRRALLLQKDILEQSGHLALHEDLLAVGGMAQASRAQAEAYLQDGAAAFDKAVEVTRTPFPFQFKLHAYVKPYLIQGSQEMIDAGGQREAMLWIALSLLVANTAIQLDAPEADRPAFQAQAERLATAAGLASLSDVQARRQQAQALTDRVFQAADEIVSRNPAIVD